MSEVEKQGLLQWSGWSWPGWLGVGAIAAVGGAIAAVLADVPIVSGYLKDLPTAYYLGVGSAAGGVGAGFLIALAITGQPVSNGARRKRMAMLAMISFVVGVILVGFGTAVTTGGTNGPVDSISQSSLSKTSPVPQTLLGVPSRFLGQWQGTIHFVSPPADAILIVTLTSGVAGETVGTANFPGECPGAYPTLKLVYAQSESLQVDMPGGCNINSHGVAGRITLNLSNEDRRMDWSGGGGTAPLGRVA